MEHCRWSEYKITECDDREFYGLPVAPRQVLIGIVVQEWSYFKDRSLRQVISELSPITIYKIYEIDYIDYDEDDDMDINNSYTFTDGQVALLLFEWLQEFDNTDPSKIRLPDEVVRRY